MTVGKAGGVGAPQWRFPLACPQCWKHLPPLQNRMSRTAQGLAPGINPRVPVPPGLQKCQPSVIADSREASLKVIHASIGCRGDILETPAEGLLEE